MSELFGDRQKQSLVVLILLLAAGAWVAMRSGGPDDPEERVRTIVEDLVKAAEDRKVDPFRKYLSEEVRDDNNLNKEDMINRLRALFFRHRTISLTIFNLDVVTSSNPNQIDAQLTLLMSETIFPSDRGEFLLTFRNEGDTWRVWSIKWGQGYGVD